MNIKTTENQKGMVAILTIVIISASVLIMAISASLLGLGELDMGYTSQRGAEAFSIADGCVEEALRRIRLDEAYTSTDASLFINQGACIMNVIGDDVKTITVIASTTDGYYKKIEVNISINDSVIVINSWKEKSN